MSGGRRGFMRYGLAALAAAGVAGAAAARYEAGRRARSAEALWPPLGPRVEVDVGVGPMRMHLVDLGPRDAPAIVLIHGASGNLRDFTFGFANRLADRFRVVAIDRPGFGHSDRLPARPSGGAPIEPWRPDYQARAMRAAVREIGLERAVLVGHSLGAASALAWALDAPDSVDGVVSLAGVSHPWPGSAGLLYDVATAPIVGVAAAYAPSLVWSDAAMSRTLDGIFAPQSAPPGYAAHLGAALALRPTTFRYNAEDIAFLKPLLQDQAERYRRYPGRIEALHGDRDTVVSALIHSQPLAATAPNARLTMLAGVGHMPHHVAPDAAQAAIERLAVGA